MGSSCLWVAEIFGYPILIHTHLLHAAAIHYAGCSQVVAQKTCLSSVSFTASCGTKSLIAVSSFSFEIALPLQRYSPFLQHFMWGKSPNRCHTQWFQHETTGASKLKCFKAFLPASARLQARLYMSEKQRV
jgi:hypothetical protein